jgi:hypothetical protein
LMMLYLTLKHQHDRYSLIMVTMTVTVDHESRITSYSIDKKQIKSLSLQTREGSPKYIITFHDSWGSIS